MVVNDLRTACAQVAARASDVRVLEDAIGSYASLIGPVPPALPGTLPVHVGVDPGARRDVAWFAITLDAINFGSGWFPTLDKPPGLSGYGTISRGLRARFDASGPWSATELEGLEAGDLAEVCGQRTDHPLMELFAASLRDLGGRLAVEWAGDPIALIDAAGGSAVALVESLAGWDCFADVSRYGDLVLPFLKRAQITAADLHRAGVATFDDLGALTMFADNLVPHVLRLDGVLWFSDGLVDRIDAGVPIEHGSREEVEIRACAVHAVELLSAATGASPAALDGVLWNRGGAPFYKARPRHRSRCTAY